MRFFIHAGESLLLLARSSVASTLFAHAQCITLGGVPFEIRVRAVVTGATRVVEEFPGESVAPADGWVYSGGVNIQEGAAKRGQTWVELFLSNRRSYMLGGYSYAGRVVPVGDFQDPGPGGGTGWLRWEQEANDVAGNVTTTITLGTNDGRRRVYAAVALYHCSGDVADRALDWQLKDLGSSTKPTGFSIQANSWVSAAMTLSANQEGVYTIGNSNFVSRNDAGVLTYDDNTTVPNPFPLWVPDADPVDLVFRAVLGEVADDYDIWVLYEEWIEP